MNHLITEAVEILNDGNFEYAICGGFAIELFLGKTTRKHGDIDILVYWKDRDNIIKYMQSLGWEVYEMCGGGVAHHILNIDKQLRMKRNIFCVKGNCELVKLSPHQEQDMYYIDFDHRGQSKLNFIEFLFNDRTEGEFLYARNHEITRKLSRAILQRDKITYLAPEIIFLYKSTDVNREGYQLDYEEAMSAMDSEQKQWLKYALMKQNPEGHVWIDMFEQ